MINQKEKVSKTIFITSIILAIIAMFAGIFVLYKEEYIIGGGMLFVLILQIHNIISYKRQNGK